MKGCQIVYLPGLMLLTTARKAFPSLQLGPKSLTCTPSCLETWACTHWSKAFLAPTFHFSWVFLLMLPSRTDLKSHNLQVSISCKVILAKLPIIVSAACITTSVNAWTGIALTKFLKNTCIFFNLQEVSIVFLKEKALKHS